MDNPSNDAVEPIAVVGMGCRFPGTATSPSRLWQMLHNGESAWSGIPQSRMNVASYFHPNRNRQGTIPFQAAHFLQEDVAAFDSSFFSIPADEAKAIDPQQRMLLEVAVEALCFLAGIDRAAIRKSETGVWIGSFVKDYEQVVLRDPDNAPKYGATGNGIAIMSNRISFFLDVNGPSMTIDTGCSASLVCLHNACQALRDHEIDMGLTGGAGMILSPNTMLPMTALNFLSPDGKCYTFDARANGYGRGEGIGIVVLKRLQDAIRDNDNIRAVIRGSRVNQDGRTPGITLPSARAQLRNIKSLYEKAGIPVQSTAYVECHGTGTQAGDWRELRAVSSAFCEQRTSDNPIIENGVIPKHLNFEAPGNPAIDFDGWKIKVPIANTPWPVDGLRRASINCFGFGGTNAHVILDDAAHYLSERRLLAHHNTIGVKDAQGSSALPACEGDKSAFADTMRDLVGPTQGGQIPSRDSTTHLFVFSAHEQKVLSKMVQDYASHVGALGDAATGNIMEDLAYTLGCRRTKLAWKASVAARSPQDLVAKLQELQPTDFIRTSEDKATKVAFVFGGQGAQWFAMGRELLGFDIFLQSILEATLYMQTHLESSFSLLMELLRDEDSSRINQPEVSQPATTAIQVALVDLLTTFFGISPNSVCGHSSGEIAAAYAMGAISREDAWQLAFYRGHCAGAMHASEGKDFPKGSMLAVGLSAPEAQKYVDLVGNKRAVVACINSPASVTLSGDSEAIRELHEYFQAARIFSRLRSIAHIVPREPTCKAVPHPHNQGKLVTPSDICLGDRLLDLPPSSETPAMYSSVTGHAISWEKLGPEYWVANMVCPVLFSEAMHQMVNSEGDEKPSIVFELSPHSSLQGPIKQILDREEKLRQPPAYFSALRRSKDAAITTLEAVGKLWGHGCDISMPWVVMRNVQTGRPKLLVDLPKYPWNHDKVYWYESHLSRANRFQVHGRYDLIGRPTLDSNPFYPRWRGFFRVSENPWIRDHQVQKTMIYPAAGMVAMVLEAAKQMASEGASGFEITRFKILKAMLIPSTSHGLEYVLNFNKHDSQKATSSARRAQSSSSAAPSTAFGFSISTKQLDGPWEEHGSGFVTILYRQSTEGARAEHQALQGSLAHTESRYNAYHNARVNCDEVVIPRQLYETLDVIGMNYGPLFQNIASLHKRDNACASIIRIPDTKSGMPASFEYPHIVHPATLDSIFQTAFALSSDPMVPSFLGSLYVSAESHKLSRSGEQLATYTRAERRGVRDASASFVVSDDSWLRPHGPRASPLIIVKDLHFTALTPNPASIANMFLPNHRNLCSEIVWEALDDSSSSMEEQEPAKDTENPLERLKGVLIDVLILIPEDVSPGINRLCDEFADIPCMGRQFRTLRSIGDDEILPEICISLIEADGQAMIWSWSEQEFIAFRNILTSVKGMFWITRGSQLEARNPRSSLVQALGRTIHSEYPKKKVVTFDIDVGNDFTDAEAEPLSRIVLRLFGKALGPESTKPVETEYIERNGQIMVPRLVLVKPLNSMIERGSAPAEPELLPMPAPHERPLKLEIGQLGQTDTFYWYDDPDASRPVLPDEVKVRVALTTLSDLDNDVLRGRAHSGLIGTDMYGVVEQTGKNVTNVTVGDHVVGIARGSLGDYIKCHHRLVYKVTENPIINPCQLTGFSIARYAIEGLKAGETILVHAGASIFGQAAIQLAKSVGATIFATAKTNRQRGTLSHYWEIPEDHILDARRDGLVDAILRLTDNNGVDVIYDTTARSRDSNLSCIREGGRIVGFANKPDKNKMTAHQGNVSGKTFSCTIIDVPHLIKHQSHKLGDALTFVCPRVMSGDFGVWRPNTQVYKYSDLTAAFTELAADKAGALIYCQRPASEPVPIIPQSPRPTSDSLRADATYVLSGGLGGLGVEIAKLLAANGVKNIVFLSRSGTASALVESGLEGLRSGGTNVRIYKVDICDRNALSRVSGVIEQCMPPVKGVFQCAAVLRDSVFENMTYEDWKLATKPKTEGSWNLYQIFGNGPDFFVFLSSTAGVIGNRGQPNYAAGNAFQDSLARHINTTSNGGTRAVSIDLGPILGAGMLAEDPQMLDKLKASGFFGIRLQDFKRVVECAITGYTEGGQTMPAQVVTGVGTGGLTRQNKPADPYWTRTAMFTHLNREDMPETDLDDSSESQDTMRKLLARTVDKEEARCIIVEGLREMLSKSMNMHASDVDESKPPSAYGVDSLVAVGVRSWVFRECEVDVSIFEVLSEISIGELSAMIVQRRAVV